MDSLKGVAHTSSTHETNMLRIKCTFGQGYRYISSLVFTTDFFSWPVETTIAST